ncbi:MAG TPA: hypothetical protein VFK05_26360 [Polyangiaceae bacterium]|nr:hypothetical protein [Polyangiaceae bacterium]
MKIRCMVGLIGCALLSASCAFPGVDLGDLPAAGPGTGDSSGAGGSHATEGGKAGATSGGTDASPGAIDVALGDYHGCAALSDGSVWCWGNNYGGMLGNGTETSSQPPVRVLGLSHPAVAVDAAYTDSCAQSSAGLLECWGSNLYGQLGDGTLIQRNQPVPSLGYPVQQVSLGEYHSCALLPDGKVQCWGEDSGGSVGDGDTAEFTGADAHPQPYTLPLTQTALQVSAGARNTCLLLSDHTVSCWGTNVTSDLCDSLNVKHLSPTPIVGVSDVTQVSSGYAHVCALHVDGGVTCWGFSDHDQLGDAEPGSAAICPDTSLVRRPPARVAGLHDVTQLAAGAYHTCALQADGTVWCWGNNRKGQLGDGTTTTHPTPTQVSSLGAAAVKLSASVSQSCAVLADGTLWCWGSAETPAYDAPVQTAPAQLHFN